MRFRPLLLAATACCVLATQAHATLIQRTGQTIYDDVRNVTWMVDLNNAKTTGLSSDGALNWNGAKFWAGQLYIAGFHDWRLPSCEGTGPGSCELEYFFNTLLGIDSEHPAMFPPAAGTQAFNRRLFINLDLFDASDADTLYWSSTRGTQHGIPTATSIIPRNGALSTSAIISPGRAFAMRDGDVLSSNPNPGPGPDPTPGGNQVPEPQSIALVLLALGLSAAASKRKRPVRVREVRSPAAS